MDLVATVEKLRRIQAQCNGYERADGTGNVVLAHTDHAWGHLHRAMVDILAEWFVTGQGCEPEYARRLAERVIDEVYDNGEDISYNIGLLANGEIEPYPVTA